jgi:hypothetical protein
MRLAGDFAESLQLPSQCSTDKRSALTAYIGAALIKEGGTLIAASIDPLGTTAQFGKIW